MFKVKNYMGKVVNVYAVNKDVEVEKGCEYGYNFCNEKDTTEFLVYDRHWYWINADNCEPIEE